MSRPFPQVARPEPVSVPPNAGRWRGAVVECLVLPIHEVENHISSHFSVDLHLSRPYHLEWKRNGAYCRTWMSPDNLCIMPAHESYSMRWQEPLEILKVVLDPSLLLQTAREMKLSDTPEIPRRHGASDAQIAHICRSLWAESKAGYPSGRLFGEALATALSVALVQRYSVQRSQAPLENKLSPRCWARVRDFIESNLDHDVSLGDLSQIAQLSPYYFSRCFKATIGTTPHQYVISRRVERAQQLLLGSSLSPAHVARECGFADQSHLTRHMKRLLGVTPAALMSERRINRKNLPETQEPSRFGRSPISQ